MCAMYVERIGKLSDKSCRLLDIHLESCQIHWGSVGKVWGASWKFIRQHWEIIGPHWEMVVSVLEPIGDALNCICLGSRWRIL